MGMAWLCLPPGAGPWPLPSLSTSLGPVGRNLGHRAPRRQAAGRGWLGHCVTREETEAQFPLRLLCLRRTPLHPAHSQSHLLLIVGAGPPSTVLMSKVILPLLKLQEQGFKGGTPWESHSSPQARPGER